MSANISNYQKTTRVSVLDKKMWFNIHKSHRINACSKALIPKISACYPKYPINALKRHSLNTHKFKHIHVILSLWGPFIANQRVVTEWIHIHLRLLAHVQIPYLRTNKWPEETLFTKMVCNAPAARFCLSSLRFRTTKTAAIERKKVPHSKLLCGIF